MSQPPVGGRRLVHAPLRRRVLVACALVAIPALAGLVWSRADTAVAAFPGHNGQIGFQSNRDTANFEIYSMNPDGGCQQRLTHSNPAFDGFPAWSPNGRKIAFQSTRDGANEIYVMNADGSDQTRLTRSDAFDGGPAWSPDGRRIAFRSNRDGNPEVYVMNADGSAQTRLTHNPGFDWAPSWSPDGRRIAFASARDESPMLQRSERDTQIYVMNADGSGQTRLTFTAAEDAAPDWSPNGRRIVFDSDREGTSSIYMMNANGSAQTRLTDDSASDGGPAWSPDGQRIAFRSERPHVHEIWSMSQDGTDLIRLTERAWSNRRPHWQPLRRPSNNFCFGNRRQNTKRGFVRQRVRVPGPGTIILRRSELVRRFVREAEDAGGVGVLVRPRGAAKRRLDRAGTISRRRQVNVRAEIGFRPDGGRRRLETITVPLVRVAQR